MNSTKIFWIVALVSATLFLHGCNDIQAKAGITANVIETTTFEHRDKSSVDAFFVANQNVEDLHISQQSRFVSRKISKNDNGWLVVVEWIDLESTKAPTQSFASAPRTDFMNAINPISMRMERFSIER